MLSITAWLVQCIYCLFVILCGITTFKHTISIHAYPIDTLDSPSYTPQHQNIISHGTPSPSHLHLVERSDGKQEPLLEIVAPNINLFVALDGGSLASTPSSAPTTGKNSNGGSDNATQPKISLSTTSAIQPNQIYHVNDSQLVGAGDVIPMTGNLIEWKIGCDLGNRFPIYPPTENPWIALLSSALLKPDSLNINNSTYNDDDGDEIEVCNISSLISILQAISSDITGVIVYHDNSSTISFQDLKQQTKNAIQSNFFVQTPITSSEQTSGVGDRLLKRNLKGMSKEEFLAKMKADQDYREKLSTEGQIARKMSVLSEPSFTSSDSNSNGNIASPGDVPASPNDPSQSPATPSAPSLDIIALNDDVLIKILLNSVQSKDKPVIVQMKFTGAAIYPILPITPTIQSPPIAPTVITERPKADHSLGLFFWIVLGSVVLIVAIWVGFGVVEARSLARRRQQISLENVRLRTVDQKVLDTYKVKIFQEKDIIYEDDENDEDHDDAALLPLSGPSLYPRNPEKHEGDSDRRVNMEELEEKGYYPESTSSSAHKMASRSDLSVLRYPPNPLMITRRSGSFDETLYGGLEYSAGRRASAQGSIFPERRPSVISSTVMNRNDRCRSWVEGKNSIYDDYGGDSESCYGHDHSEGYKSHAQEGWTNLKIDSLQPIDGSMEKSKSDVKSEPESGITEDSSHKNSSSLVRKKSLPSLPMPIATTELVRRKSLGAVHGNNLYVPPTLRHKNGFVLPRKIETDLPSLFVIPTNDILSATVYEGSASSAGPSTGGFLPPPGWGGERRRSSHSTVAVPDNGRGIAQPNWAGPRGQRLRRSSAQVHRIGAHGSQTNDDESDMEHSSDTDDGHGVGPANVSPIKEKHPRPSLEKVLVSDHDTFAPTLRKELKEKEPIKSPIEEQKAKFTMIGLDLPNVYSPTAGEFSRISFDADEVINNSMGYNTWGRRRQRQRNEKNGQQMMEELQDIDEISGDDYSKPVNLSTISPTERTATGKSKSGKSTEQKKQKRRKYDPCAICLEEYEVGDKLRELPCKHFFHTQCIDPWFKDVHGICPVCKRDYSQAGNSDSRTTRRASTTMERPSGVLAFLSPLSMFSAGVPVGAHYWYAAEASAHM